MILISDIKIINLVKPKSLLIQPEYITSHRITNKVEADQIINSWCWNGEVSFRVKQENNFVKILNGRPPFPPKF